MLLSAYHTLTRPSVGTVVVAILLLGICARALAQDRRRTEPVDIPVHLPHGLRVDSARVTDLLRRVLAAVQRSNVYVEIWQVPPDWTEARRFSAAAHAAPETLRDIPKNIWQGLSNGRAGTEQQDFCVVADIWHRLSKWLDSRRFYGFSEVPERCCIG